MNKSIFILFVFLFILSGTFGMNKAYGQGNESSIKSYNHQDELQGKFSAWQIQLNAKNDSMPQLDSMNAH